MRIVMLTVAAIFLYRPVFGQNTDTDQGSQGGAAELRATAEQQMQQSAPDLTQGALEASGRQGPSWIKAALVGSNVPVCIYLTEQYNWGGRDKRPGRGAPHWRTEVDTQSYGWDIAGNSLATYFVTRNLRYAYEFAGFSPKTSLVLAGANVLLIHGFAKYYESQVWGAQKHDLFSAWGGIAFAVAQGYVPELERIQYKWIYHNDGLAKKYSEYTFLEDYGRQRFFISVRLGDLFFESKLLRGLGICYGGGPLGDYSGTRHYIGLDFDIREILPGTLGEELNYLHIPLPAVYVQNGVWGLAFSL